MTRIRPTLGFLCLLCLAACATQVDPTDETPQWRQSVGFYSPDGALYSIEANAPFRTVKLLENGVSAAFLTKKFSFKDGVIVSSRPHSLISYAEGSWYESELDTGAQPLVTKLYSVTNPTPLCSAKVVPQNLSSETASELVFFQLAGADVKCNTSDDHFEVASARHEAEGIAREVEGLPTAIFYSSTASLTGMVVLEKSALTFRDSKLNKTKDLLKGVHVAYEVAHSSESALLVVDDTLRTVTVTGDLSEPLHTFSDGYCLCFAPTQDDQYLFFAESLMPNLDETLIWRIKLNSVEPAIKMAKLSERVPYLTTTKTKVVVYSEGAGSRVSLLGKESVYPASLQTIEAVSQGSISLAPVQQYIAITIRDDSIEHFGITARLIGEDGSVFLSLPRSRWVGHIFETVGHPHDRVYKEISTLLAVEGLSEVNGQGGDQGAQLVSYTVSTLKREVIQTLSKSGYYALVDDATPGLGIIRSGGASGLQSDVVRFDLAAKTLTVVTDTPESEVPILWRP